MNLKKYAGVFLALAGSAMLFPFSATGAVIGTVLRSMGTILGLALLIGGLMLTIYSLEDETSNMRVYTAKSKTGKYEPHLIDPTLTLGGADITLKEFQEGVNEIKDDPELISLVRRTYLRPLQELRKTNKDLAEKFLEVIGISQDPEESYRLSSKERQGIKEAFRTGYDGKNKRQSELLKHYGIEVSQTNGGHKRFSLNENSIVTGSTPSDYRSPMNFVKQLIHFIEENYDSN